MDLHEIRRVDRLGSNKNDWILIISNPQIRAPVGRDSTALYAHTAICHNLSSNRSRAGEVVECGE